MAKVKGIELISPEIGVFLLISSGLVVRLVHSDKNLKPERVTSQKFMATISSPYLFITLNLDTSIDHVNL